MTPTEQNEFLAQYTGWISIPNPYTESWDTFQLAFQKAYNALPDYICKNIMQHFAENDLAAAIDDLILGIQEIKTNKTK